MPSSIKRSHSTVCRILGFVALFALAACAGVPTLDNPASMPASYSPMGIELLRIPSGSFEMGCPADETGRRNDEIGQKHVWITHTYYIGKYAVTVKQWRALMGFVPGEAMGRLSSDDLPIVGVSWKEAVAFCGKLTAEEQAAGRLPVGYVYGLPSEAQWEYAARAGSTAARYGDLDAIAWYRENSSGRPHPVGRKEPNARGLYDMIGNVWQWCSDKYLPPMLREALERGEDVSYFGPVPPTMRSLRGGSWIDSADRCRAAARRHNQEDTRGMAIGFRLALVPEHGQ